MVQNNQESRRKNWTTRSSLRSFACTAHCCSAPLALLACSAMLICSLACSFTHSLSHGKVNGKMSQNDPVLSHSALIYLKLHSSFFKKVVHCSLPQYYTNDKAPTSSRAPLPLPLASHYDTMVQENQKSRRKYWATRLSFCSFPRTAHSLACLLTPKFARKRMISWLFSSVQDHSA